MSKVARDNRIFYMLDDFQRDVAKQAKREGTDDLDTISDSLVKICIAAGRAIKSVRPSEGNSKPNVPDLVCDISEMLWQVAHIAECAGVQMSDLAGYAVDKHSGRSRLVN